MKEIKNESKSKKIEKILKEMQIKMSEIDKIREDIRKEKNSGFSPQQTSLMLEEIKIPKIEVLRENKKKKW
ncbi:MAG: hypothetical protein QXI10_01725 [Candidatus Diapherotrites archaeon]